MNRREFIALSGFLASSTVFAQEPAKVPRVAFLYPGPQQAAVTRIEAMLSGLRSQGFTAPAKVELVVRATEGDPSLIPSVVAESIERNVDVIFAIGSAVLQAARSASRTMPIVAVDLETDPIASGVAASLARPGGNITGLFFDFPNFTVKWLELLKEFTPQLARVCVLWDPNTSRVQLDGLERASGPLNIRVEVLEVRT